jgi:3',5'-cyclic AMP phosphodiesterase CpdA
VARRLAALRTAPALGARPPHLAALGDSGDGSSREWEVARALARARPDLLIHTGDVVYPNGLARDYGRGLFEPFHHVLALAPMYPTMGNHDAGRTGGKAFRDVFALPVNDEDGTENYYSFDYGNAHFTCVNSNSQVAALRPGSPQWRWLQRDLSRSRARWKIVFFHHPPFSATERGARPRLRAVVALFERTGVSLVLNGHAHAYERTRPIRTGRAAIRRVRHHGRRGRRARGRGQRAVHRLLTEGLPLRLGARDAGGAPSFRDRSQERGTL